MEGGILLLPGTVGPCHSCEGRNPVIYVSIRHLEPYNNVDFLSPEAPSLVGGVLLVFSPSNLFGGSSFFLIFDIIMIFYSRNHHSSIII